MKFFKCAHCGNVIAYTNDKGVPVVCCGEEMKELIPNSTDANPKTHIPLIREVAEEVTIRVGEEFHPMTKEHHIDWVAIHTKEGNQRKELKGDTPTIQFMLCEEDRVIAAYAYCNLHGLWKAEYID